MRPGLRLQERWIVRPARPGFLTPVRGERRSPPSQDLLRSASAFSWTPDDCGMRLAERVQVPNSSIDSPESSTWGLPPNVVAVQQRSPPPNVVAVQRRSPPFSAVPRSGNIRSAAKPIFVASSPCHCFAEHMTRPRLQAFSHRTWVTALRLATERSSKERAGENSGRFRSRAHMQSVSARVRTERRGA